MIVVQIFVSLFVHPIRLVAFFPLHFRMFALNFLLPPDFQASQCAVDTRKQRAKSDFIIIGTIQKLKQLNTHSLSISHTQTRAQFLSLMLELFKNFSSLFSLFVCVDVCVCGV